MAARAVRVGGRECPETVEGRFEIASQLQRIEALVERFEIRVCGAREDPAAASRW
jgi:hypothetical protein